MKKIALNYFLDIIVIIVGISISFYLEKNARFTNFIHHTSYIFETANIGLGNVICRNCLIGPNVKIENFNTFNNNSNIGHDSIIGDNCVSGVNFKNFDFQTPNK